MANRIGARSEISLLLADVDGTLLTEEPDSEVTEPDGNNGGVVDLLRTPLRMPAAATATIGAMPNDVLMLKSAASASLWAVPGSTSNGRRKPLLTATTKVARD